MRAALWIALLLAAFVLAWRIQDRWATERRQERDAAYARFSEADGVLPEGFSRVVVGRPSGADIVEPPPGSRPTARPDAGPESSAHGEPTELARHVVVAGDSLSEICERHYGTSRKAVVEAVARANGLSNPGAIRVGQRLVLPALSDLGN